MFMKCGTKIRVIHFFLLKCIRNECDKALYFIPYMVRVKICYCHDNDLIKYRENVTNIGGPMSVNAK